MTAVETDNEASIGQNSDYSTGIGGGASGGGGWGGFNAVNSGNKALDILIGGLFPGLSIIDRLAGVHLGDGIPRSGDPAGGASGPQDAIEQIITAMIERAQPTRQPITANPRAGQEGSRRPGNTVGANMRYPNRGSSTLRRGRTGSDDPYMMDRKPGWENPPADLVNMRSIDDMSPRFGRVIDDMMPAPGGGGDSVDSMLGPNAGMQRLIDTLGQRSQQQTGAITNAIQHANTATMDRSGGLQHLLGRGAARGDFALDENAASVVNPMMMDARNNALQSLMRGSRVSDNLFDLTSMGANIGAKQGAQNINVRSRIPSRTRRF